VDASIDVSNTRGPLISSLMQGEFRRFHSQKANRP
jgi:hypothetical protein